MNSVYLSLIFITITLLGYRTNINPTIPPSPFLNSCSNVIIKVYYFWKFLLYTTFSVSQNPPVDSLSVKMVSVSFVVSSHFTYTALLLAPIYGITLDFSVFQWFV